MKKILVPFIVLFLFISFGNNVDAKSLKIDSDNSAIQPIENQKDLKFDVNKDLSGEEISERFYIINSTYALEEPFTEEDTEFIRYYAQFNDTEAKSDDLFSNKLKEPLLTPAAVDLLPGKTNKWSFGEQKTVGGVKVDFFGTIYATLGYVNHSYRGQIGARILSGANHVTGLSLHTTSVTYGLIGAKKVGIVYNGKVSSSKNDTTITMDKTGKYVAVGVVYSNTNAYVSVESKKGKSKS